MRKFTENLALAAAGVSAIGGAGTMLLATAAPASADTGTYSIAYSSSAGPVVNGSATIIRTGNSVEVKISLDSGSTFSGQSGDLQVCASTSAFSTKAAGDNCSTSKGIPDAQLFQYTESGTAADETFALGNTYTGTAAYLQVHLNTLDNENGKVVANTSEVNPVSNSTPLYGNVKTDPMPAAAVGALGLAGGLGGLFLVLQRRRRRSTAVTGS